MQLLPNRDRLALSVDGVRHGMRRSMIIVSLVYAFLIHHHHLRLRSTRSPLLIHDLIISLHSYRRSTPVNRKKIKKKNEKKEERGQDSESLGFRYGASRGGIVLYIHTQIFPFLSFFFVLAR